MSAERDGKPATWDWILRLVQVVLVPLLVYGIAKLDDLAKSVQQNREAIVAIQNNRFTTQDGLKMQQEMARMWAEIAVLPKEVPPKWFLDRVDKMEAASDARISKLEESINQLRDEVRQKQ